MTLLTIKVPHQNDFSSLLEKAYLVGIFAINNRDKLSSKYVSDLGLPSAISNQVLRKYGRSKKCKNIIKNKVKLIVPNQSIKYNKKNIKIKCLDLEFEFKYPRYKFNKINQIEIDNKFYYIAIDAKEKKLKKVKNYIGIDLNSTGFAAVAANPKTGKVLKLGKESNHTKTKYRNIRRKYTKQKRFKEINLIKNRETNKIKDLNHKIANAICDFALQNRSGIKLEKLTNIRKNCTKKYKKKTNSSLNSWSFAALQQMIEYKAKLLGIPVIYVNPFNTSKKCSKCGEIGERDKKSFKCPSCGHVDHADVNAAFNIALTPAIDCIKTEINAKGELIPLISSCAEGAQT